MEGKMEENNDVDDASMIGQAEDLSDSFSDFSGFLMQRSRRLSSVPTTGNGSLRPEVHPFYPHVPTTGNGVLHGFLRPEVDPFYPPVPTTENGLLGPKVGPFYPEEDYWFQSSRNVRNFLEYPTMENRPLHPVVDPFLPEEYWFQSSRNVRNFHGNPTTGNRHHHQEVDPFYSEEYWVQSSRNVRNFPENHNPASLEPYVFYSDDMHQIRGNGAIYSPPVSSRNNLLNFRPQASWDPFCPGGESFRDPRSMDYGAPHDDFSLEAKFARLKLLHDYNQTSLSEPLSVHGNSSSLNRLRENQQFSSGDLQALRARAAANGFMLQQAYHPSLNSDSYWVNRDSDGFRNILRDTNRGMNIGGGFNSWNHMQVSMNGVNSNMSWIPSPPCNGYLHSWVPYSDLKGRVLSEAMDQQGCRFLRQKLHEGKPEDIQMILSEVKHHIYMLLHDRFGNHVLQKLFEVCNQEQMSQLVSAVTADGHLLMSVCLDPQGSQSIQKFVQCLVQPEQISRMMSIFRHMTIPLVNNQIGARVIQRCINIFPAEETMEIVNVVVDHCVQLATNQSGCCIVQLCITKDSPLESQRRIVTEIVLNINELSKHQFGNYVVQHVIGLEIPCVMEGIVAGMKGNFVSLSMDKYGSNVVEKLMKACQEKFVPRIINEFISNSLNFLNVVLDPYGNYVVQSAKTHATGASRKSLNKLILEHSNELRSHPYGKNVLLNKEKARHSV